MKALLFFLLLPLSLAAAEPLRLRMDNIRVIHFGPADDLGKVPLKLKPWDIRWIEVE